MKSFKEYLLENDTIETFMWDGPLYHGTSMFIAKKVIKQRLFAPNDSKGYNEIGSGVYTHPSMNRTSPWVRGMSNGKLSGAFIEIRFTRPLKLAILKRGMGDQRSIIDQGFDGVYDKTGYTQIAHQILLYNRKPIDSDLPDLNKDLIDWDRTKIIPFDDDMHGYLNGFNNEDEKKYY